MYKLNTAVIKVLFPGDPTGQAYFLIRQGGRKAPKKREQLVSEALATLGKASEEELSFELRQELTHRSACGTWVLGWAGFYDEDRRPLRCLPALGDDGLPADFASIDEGQYLELLEDPIVSNWLFGVVFPTFADRVLESFKAAEGNSAPRPAGTGTGAEVMAN